MINISKEDMILMFVHKAYMSALEDDNSDAFTKEQLDRCFKTTAELNRVVELYKSLDDEKEQEKLNEELEGFFKETVKGL